MNDNLKKAAREILNNYLELNNHRKTPERYAILDAVFDIKGHFSLETLGDKLIKEDKFPVSRATLYNTIKLFIELRIVIRHKFLGSTMYEVCIDNNNHCHQICTVCGKVTEIYIPAINKAFDDARLKRFRKDGFTLYIYGICSTCAAKQTRRKTYEEKLRS